MRSSSMHASAALRARRVRRLGAIALAEQPLEVAPDDETARMLAEGVAAARPRSAALDQGAARNGATG